VERISSLLASRPIHAASEREGALLRASVADIGHTKKPLVGKSLAMRRLVNQIERVAPTQASVLIRGETGTGKDVVAHMIHALSSRANGPFVVIDCSALSPSLAESELFGHERGAFTGAQGARAGLFEEANGGTVFLDELGELPKELQPKLLRVLEQRMVRRVGSSRQTPIDVRVICATHRNLREEVALGRFREDLYYRVAAISLEVPALRERLEDLHLLVDHFLRQDGLPLRLDQIPESSWQALEEHPWPGNVRELRNVVQRLLLTPGQPFGDSVRDEYQPAESQVMMRPVALPSAMESESANAVRREDASELPRLRSARRQCMTNFERDYLLRVLEASEHNVTHAAKLAGVSRQMIQRLMSKHRIRRG
jgi:transcriptional regulator with GAF, ATPase, and Fis domain